MHVEQIETGVTARNEGATRTRLFRFILDKFYSDRKWSIVDLGAGPCVFAKIARDVGHDVTAVDARTVRVPDDLGTIQFVQADVRNFDIGPYELVVCLGLIYHFDLDEQRALLRKFKGKPAIIDSQVHVPELVAPDTGSWQYEIVQREGFEGVVYPEKDNPMASIGNPTSFWHTEPSMIRLFEDSGFEETVVFGPLFQSKYGGRRMYMCR